MSCLRFSVPMWFRSTVIGTRMLARSRSDTRCLCRARRVLRCLLRPGSVFCRRDQSDSGCCVTRGTQTSPSRNQLGPTGGVDLAIEIGAVSADHLDHLTDGQIAALGASSTVATLLPTVSLSMRIPQPRGVDLWNAGATVAIASDCNPGRRTSRTCKWLWRWRSLRCG